MPPNPPRGTRLWRVVWCLWHAKHAPLQKSGSALGVPCLTLLWVVAYVYLYSKPSFSCMFLLLYQSRKHRNVFASISSFWIWPRPKLQQSPNVRIALLKFSQVGLGIPWEGWSGFLSCSIRNLRSIYLTDLSHYTSLGRGAMWSTHTVKYCGTPPHCPLECLTHLAIWRGHRLLHWCFTTSVVNLI